jgi:signal transduction histidine kinase
MHSDGNKTRADLAKELAALRQKIAELFTSEAKQKRVEEVLQKRTHALGMRVKELNCLFDISRLVQRQDVSWDEILRGIANMIPPAWQHSEITCARIILEDQEVRTSHFRKTIWKQAEDITVHGERAGSVEVYYLEEKPERNHGPFLKEERSLLTAIAELMGLVIERKQAEEGLQKAHDELELQVEARTAELARLNEELRTEIVERKRVEKALRESSEKLKTFAFSIVHDLKSPAIGIHGLTELLHRRYKDSLEESGKLYCDQILKASVHIAALIEKINDYIAMKEGPLKVERINVKDVLQIVREEFSPRVSIRQIQWVEPETIGEIRADKISMIRVFRNFVDNALKYGGEDLSEIRIGYKECDDSHVFSVSDNGAGVREADFARIFAPFLRAETSNSVEGAGLGLAIVREIAERHGGRVWAEPGRRKGTTFHMSILQDL